MGEEIERPIGGVMDKAMTIDEIRKYSANWSLSSDAEMLNYLQNYSQKMISRTHELQQQLNAVLHEAKLTSVRVNSTFNDFIMLANTQFVENRVYDEDVTQKDETEQSSSMKKEKTKEEREAEIIPKISEAIKLGLGVIETAFEKLDMNEGNSDSDEEDTGYKPDPILEPKDPYLNRPLPYLIGSQAFQQDDDVGLIDYFSEDEEEPPEEESESESESSEEEQEVMKSQSQPSSKMRKDVSSDDDSQESDLFDGESHESEDDDDFGPPQHKEPGQVKSKQNKTDEDDSDDDFEAEGSAARDFTSELAAKIGAAPVVPPETTKENKVQQHTKKKKDKSKKQSKMHDSDDNDDLFSAPKHSIRDFDDEESPFGKGGGLFSSKSGGGLFDDVENDLFDEIVAAPSKPNKPVPNSKPMLDSDVSDDDSLQQQQENIPASPKASTKSGRKVPAGGVALFGDDTDDLFTISSSTKTATTTKTTKETIHHSTQQQKSNVVSHNERGNAPSFKPAVASGGLFDGSDEEDLFDTLSKPSSGAVTTASSKATNKTGLKQSTKSALFDGEESDDEDDMFGDKPAPSIVTPKPDSKKQEDPTKTNKKLPPGAVSMFGKVSNPLVEALKAKPKFNKSDSEEDDKDSWSEDEKKSTHSTTSATFKSTNLLSVKKEKSPSLSSNSLFADDPDDDLFSSSASASATKVTSTSQTSTTKVTSNSQIKSTKSQSNQHKVGVLFGNDESEEDDEDLFSISTKPSGKSSENVQSRSNTLLFNDEDDREDIFATTTSSSKPAPEQVKKKPVGGVALFGDTDIFVGDNPPAVKVAEKKTAAVAKPQQQPPSSNSLQVKKVENVVETTSTRTKTNSFSLFGNEDEEDKDGDIFSGSKPTKPKPTNVPVSQVKPSGKSLFADEDVLFGGTEDDNPAVDLFGSTSPLKSKPGHPNETPVSISNVEEKPKEAFTTEQPQEEENDSDDLFSDANVPPKPDTKAKKPPAGAVSMFGGMDPSALLKNRSPKPFQKPSAETITKPQVTSDLLLGEDTPHKNSNDLFSTKPAISKRPSPSASVVTKPKPPAAPSNVGKLKSNLAINPAALLPGATPPEKDTEPKAVDFDEPVKTQTLTSLAKDRPKIQQNRRPPSRQARRATASQSAYNIENVSISTSSNKQYSSLASANIHNHMNSISNQETKDSSSYVSSALKKTDISQENHHHSVFQSDHVNSDNTFTYNKKQQHSQKSTIPVSTGSSSQKTIQDVFVENGHDQSVSSRVTSSGVKVGPQNLFGSGDEDDIFSDVKVSKPIPEAENRTVTKSDSMHNVLDNKDDLFSPVKPRSGTGQSKSSERTQGSKVNLYETSTSSKASALREILGNVSAENTDPLSILTTHTQQQTVDSGESNKTVDSTEKVQSWLEKSEPVVRPSSKSVFEDGDDDIFAVTTNSSSKNKSNVPQVDTKGNVKAKSGAPAVSQNGIDEDDIFSTSKLLLPKPTKASSAMFADDDIFGEFDTSVKSKVRTSGPAADDLNSSTRSSSVKSKSEQDHITNRIDDVFANAKLGVGARGTESSEPQGPPTKSNIIDIFADTDQHDPGKNTGDAPELEDDIFADIQSVPVTKHEDSDDIFVDAYAEVKPKTSKSSKKKKAVTKDEDIFKDDTDIFADLPPAKSKERKSKKKTTTGSSSGKVLSKNDIDDIFADTSVPATSVKTSTKKTKSKGSTKSNKVSSPDAPNIFDDPLNALK